ncbi:hypothetical protein PIB30_118622 [Stylosanthes scabra]|uniref:Integrase catalytic domain-containing protein n=1 Tax=Stylosanthes scabra TaxID=79078 RepID=A0ABU6YN73_9FABA|nr:hypothetical protein [Stylosanthes scabra]
MQKDIRSHVLSCKTCQQAKVENRVPAGLLKPLPIPAQVWEDISMDFIVSLSNSAGFSVILVVVDRLTKYAHFIPLKHDFTSKVVAETFINQIVKLHGFPRSIVSDRDRVFISKFWQQLFHLQGTQLAMSSAYHPQTDGQSEVCNRTLEMYLRCFCSEHLKKWLEFLPWAEFWYNSSWHSSIKMSPFKALYGKDPPVLARYEFAAVDETSLQELLINRDQLLDQLKLNLSKSQQYMKETADKRRRHVEFEEGDLVLVKLQPYRQHSVALRKHQKLSMRYFGPFTITKKLSPVAYRLALPPAACIHDVFHISALKLFKGEVDSPYLPLPLTISEIGPILEPTCILAQRSVIRNGKDVLQWQVQWGRDKLSETSWEDVDHFLKIFPDFNLEGKVVFDGVSNDMNKEVISDAKEVHANWQGNSVTASGQLVADPQSSGLRRSNRMRYNSSRLKDFGG